VHVSSKVAPAAHEHMLLRDLRSAVEHMEKCIPRTNLSCRGCSTGWLPLFYHSAMA
jgi:hypothetical protein